MFRTLLLTICLSATAAFGQVNERAKAIEDAWAKWMDEQGISHSTLAVLRNGELQVSTSIGRPEFQPIPLASLSKSITGACIAALVDQKRTRYDATLSEILGDTRAFGSDLTLTELLTHSGGLGPDTTQNAMPRWKNLGKVQHESVTKTALTRDTQYGKRGSFDYNNENYAILGLVIEELTQKNYEDACQDLVLKPAGITSASLPKRFGAYGAFGGWSMTAEDFARFSSNVLGNGSDPFEGPKVSLGGGTYYGRGTFFRNWRGDKNYWHFGAICLRKDSIQSYFANLKGEWTIVTGFDACKLDWSILGSLDQALSHAAFK